MDRASQKEMHDAFRQLTAARLHSVYLWDLMPGYKPEHSINFGTGEQQMPGGGTIDFTNLAETLAEVGYRGALNIGVHGTTKWSLDKITAQIEQSRAFLSAI